MIDTELYNTYFNALLSGRRSQCHDIVQHLLDQHTELKTLYYELFHKSLYQVGELWETNKISVAREHLATAITDNLLNLAYPYLFRSDKKGKKVIISCSANEYHQIGGKMIADIFELNGWDSQFLGANTPTDNLLAVIDDEKPDIVGFSLSILSNIDHLRYGIESVKTHFKHMNLLVGGQAFRWGGLDMLKQYPETDYIASMDDLERNLSA